METLRTATPRTHSSALSRVAIATTAAWLAIRPSWASQAISLGFLGMAPVTRRSPAEPTPGAAALPPSLNVGSQVGRRNPHHAGAQSRLSMAICK